MTPSTITYENPHFIAVDKPPACLSVPGRMGQDDPRPCIGLWLQQHLGQAVFPVHRLDAEVSGLLLFAKTAAAHKAANTWFSERHIQKHYEALTNAATSLELNKNYIWQSIILRGKKRSYTSPHGKPAITHARAQACYQLNGISVWQWDLEPHTGRSHQLRFELAKQNAPILGDSLYGSHERFEFLHLGQTVSGIALRSVCLDFSSCQDAKRFDLPSNLRLPGFA